ncbi:MAG: hypothetical protein Q9M30_05235, partial [Mariprofundaceae bacterium]|nr:hypothetical protein [Mariprofundaceae bacterium]
GSTAPSEDGRTAILLETAERQLVLEEMRTMLASTQQIIDGLALSDMQQISQAASDVGMQATSTMDVKLKAKLPLEFKKLGFATHQAFDDIAAMAGENAGPKKIQAALAATMNNCIACHAGWQLPESNIKQALQGE